MKAHVGNNTYTFVVKGDIDGNGTINLTDIAKICLHYIEEENSINIAIVELDNVGTQNNNQGEVIKVIAQELIIKIQEILKQRNQVLKLQQRNQLMKLQISK